MTDEFHFHLKGYQSKWTRGTQPLSCSALFNLNSGYLFQGVTPNDYTLANNTTNFSRFHNIINNNDNFIELLVNNATYFFRVYIKQDWYFQRVPSKLNHEKNFFESSYHTILTLSESYSKQYWLIQSSYQTAQTIVNTFLRVSMDTWKEQKIRKWKWE